MRSVSQIAERLQQMVRQRNRELATDAILKIVIGIVFCLLTFGFVFWVALFAGCGVSGFFGLDAWQLALIVTGVFFVAAVWSAWQRVNPLADLKPLTDRQMMLTLVSQASGDILYFSPRHATAGMALVLIGGPAGLFEGLGIWAHRLRASPAIVEEASELLAACRENLSTKKIKSPAGAVLLKRLALIKIVDDSSALMLTQKGMKLLGVKSSN
jgi:hypothetical protein